MKITNFTFGEMKDVRRTTEGRHMGKDMPMN